MTEQGRDGKKLVFTKPISEKLPFQNASLAILDILFIIIYIYFFFRKPSTKLQNLKGGNLYTDYGTAELKKWKFHLEIKRFDKVNHADLWGDMVQAFWRIN